MTQRLSPSTIALLVIPPLMWAGNAVVGRLVSEQVPPMLLNLLRWTLAFALLLPLAAGVLARGSALWAYWRRFSLLGLLSVGLYNSLQYVALHTSTPLNVTLVASSTPIWMMLIGRLFFGAGVRPQQLLGALLSMAGVLLVLSRGQWDLLLQVRLVAGDVYMLAAACVWAYYSWMLTESHKEPASIRTDWAAFLMGQIVFGLLWSSVLAAGEWAVNPQRMDWSWQVAAALLFVAVGPALLAYRCWGAGVRHAGPTVAGFFANLTPLFAALLSIALLGEVPQWFHAAAFLLIASGIVLSSRKRQVSETT
ncbi:DMT family transporter [Rhodoferax sp.]|jgi:drug/metabolite transporter (DMT)-like permease|uniref:DMT family transporter n=1 Tax=Rhodoferax sp. TaxID=50421 RepID=UPI0037837D92